MIKKIPLRHIQLTEIQARQNTYKSILTGKNSHRVIFRVIGQELHIATGEVKT